MKVVINRIIPQIVELFDPNDNSLGFVNEYELNDVRIQIKENKIIGYYCLFNDEKIIIDTDGKLSNFPSGFFDLWEEQAFKLF